MNIILFDEAEAGRPLSSRDPRAVHLLKTLHKKPGDAFEAGVLGGKRGTGRIEALGPGGSLIYTLDVREDPPPRAPLRVAVGFPRPIQLRRLLRDLSSLGVAAIDLVATDLGEKSYQNTNLLDDGGARTALIEGAIQARDTRLPQLTVHATLDAWLAAPPMVGLGGPRPPSGGSGGRRPPVLLIAADNIRPDGSFSALTPGTSPETIVAVGPERGWSDRERSLFAAAGFLRLSFGLRPLRTETACVAAAVLALEKAGALG